MQQARHARPRRSPGGFLRPRQCGCLVHIPGRSHWPIQAATALRYSVRAPPTPTPSSLLSPPTEMSTGGRIAAHDANACISPEPSLVLMITSPINRRCTSRSAFHGSAPHSKHQNPWKPLPFRCPYIKGTSQPAFLGALVLSEPISV